MENQMTNEQVELFVQENFKNMKRLIDSRVFEIRSGQAILNFNAKGDLAAIEIRLKVYKD